MIEIIGGFLLVIVIMVALSLVKVHWKKGRFSRELLISAIKGTKWLRFSMLLLTIIFAGIFTFLYYHQNNSSAVAQITLNYAEASKGKNANGVRYNMSEIISDEVIERAIEKGAWENVTVPQLKDCLKVYPLVEGDSYNENDYHISTEFAVEFIKNKNTKHLNSYEVVKLIGYAYKDFYVDKYTTNFQILDINLDDNFENIDYMDVKDVLSLKIQEITNYMYGLAEENSAFTTTSGETFLSIAGKCDDLREVMIENSFEAYILQNGISKDYEQYIDRLSYDNRIYNFDYQRADANYKVCNNAVALYEEEMAKIVLVPTWDSEGQYYMGRTKVGIDELSVEAENYSEQAAGYLKEIETNKSIINSMSDSKKSGTDEYAELLIEKITADMGKLSKMAIQAVQEYSETKMNQCITVGVVKSAFWVYALLCMGVSGVFYLVTCFLFQKYD